MAESTSTTATTYNTMTLRTIKMNNCIWIRSKYQDALLPNKLEFIYWSS